MGTGFQEGAKGAPVKRLPFPAFSISLSRQDSAGDSPRQEEGPHPGEQPFQGMVDSPQHGGFWVAVIPVLVGAVQQEQEGEKCHNGRAKHDKEPVDDFPSAACYLCQLQIDHLQLFRNGSQLVCLGFRDGLSQKRADRRFQRFRQSDQQVGIGDRQPGFPNLKRQIVNVY